MWSWPGFNPSRRMMAPSSYAVHVPETVDVRGIREKLHMTQVDFARAFGFKPATLRHWEQKSCVPEGPARAYLTVIDREPGTVRRVLAGQ